MPQAPSTRWCPTPEQLMILEEMYRSGIRTPNASQIQQITAHLSYYGKIEGKNVFYWFQNHKARDRQKLRRRLSRHQQLLHLHPNTHRPHPHQIPGMEEASSPLPSPTSLNYQSPPHLFPQDGFQEANPAMNLLNKLETGGEDDEPTTSGTTYGHEWAAMMGIGSGIPPCCRPLKTLDLFPTKSTGLKDECSTSKSSSCSTSTN